MQLDARPEPDKRQHDDREVDRLPSSGGAHHRSPDVTRSAERAEKPLRPPGPRFGWSSTSAQEPAENDDAEEESEEAAEVEGAREEAPEEKPEEVLERDKIPQEAEQRPPSGPSEFNASKGRE